MYSGPKNRHALSIRLSLALWYSGTLIVLVLAMDTFLYVHLQVDLTDHYQRFLKTYAADLGANLLHHPPDSAAARLALIDELRFFRPAEVEYRLFDENGRSVFSSDGWKEVPEPIPDSESIGEGGTVIIRGVPFKTLVSSLDVAGGRKWTSQTAISLGYVDSMLRNYERNLWIVTVPLLIAGIAGGLFLARKALRPVVRMSTMAREISSQNMSQRLPLRGTGDELDHLAEALNGMLERLEESFLRIERFSSDLAHELRTPITQLVGETEAALISDMGATQLRGVLERHAEVYTRMASLTTDVLRLLRSGTASAAADEETVDLPGLMEDVIESFRALAEEKGVVLSYAVEEDVPEMLGQPPKLRRMLSNLLDNAIRHTSEGGAVDVVVRCCGDEVQLSVRDDGEGIAEKDLPRIFERFFRGENVRSSGAGFGLGLSIVKQIIDEHRGTVSVSSIEGQGTRVDVRLPLPDSAMLTREPSRAETAPEPRS